MKKEIKFSLVYRDMYRAQNEALKWGWAESDRNKLWISTLQEIDIGRPFKTKFTFGLLQVYTWEVKWGRFLCLCCLLALLPLSLLEWL